VTHHVTSLEAQQIIAEVEVIRASVKRSSTYIALSRLTIFWGVLTLFGDIFTQFYGPFAPLVWKIIYLIGFTPLVTSSLGWPGGKQKGRFNYRVLLGACMFIGFGILTTNVIGQFAPRQLSVFWPVYYMIGYSIVGLFIGDVLVAIGLVISGLTIVTYFVVQQYFDLTLALVDGVGLIVAGRWMQKI
jgi:hypothetical protein